MTKEHSGLKDLIHEFTAAVLVPLQVSVGYAGH
jgi:hypothetical protein